MSEPVYATRDDWDSFGSEAEPDPDLLDALLARASREVDSLLVGAVYAVDENEQPTDPSVRSALARATCAFVEWWDDAGDISGAAAAGGAVSLGALSLGGGTGASGSTGRTPAAAVTALRVAGLVVRVDH
ncbi:hypothetical protein D9V30_10230 [Mycetocola reblochoni]|uniref:Uncharacterized protein n=2 Tax=Mycetocola reblochoni TaxID=331618 RepID=A0A1R4JQ58_9MICO|nr:hypothetical protein [Mycetocola reblochoni]RLP68357.1 hypothetical protein D9V30_10230 [Mycetocola reblochoni]SJN34137.1 hypothetical protein FM119_08785 [Mycetocola reblochoni REB411]